MTLKHAHEELLLKIIGMMSKAGLAPNLIMDLAQLARRDDAVFRHMLRWSKEINKDKALAILDDLLDRLNHSYLTI